MNKPPDALSRARRSPMRPIRAEDHAAGAGPRGPLDLNPEFRRALDILERSDRSLLLTGRAGTGKSTLLRHFRATTRKRVAVLAPTGVAALNVEGETIHSFFGFGPDVTVAKAEEARPRQPGLYRNLDAIVLDEISMVRADLLDCVAAFLRTHGPRKGRPFGGVQMVLVGDLYQLPPVVTRDDREAFGSTYPSPWFFDAPSFQDLDLEFVELEKIYRQHDDRFIAVLNAIRNRTATDEDLAVLNARVDAGAEPGPEELVVCLTPTNAAAEEINRRRIAALPGRARTYRGVSNGRFEERTFPAPAELSLKPGAQVMMVANDAQGRYVNGSLGHVRDIVRGTKGAPDTLRIVLTDGAEIEAGPRTWDLHRYVWNKDTKRLDTETVGAYTQYPLRLAWAVTIHKAQGKTFDRVIVDLGARGALATGQTYVALSRCTSLAGLTLRRPLKPADIRVDWRVVRFLTRFQYARAAAAQPVSAKRSVLENAARERRPLSIVYLKSSDVKSTRVITPIEVAEMEFEGRPFLGVRAHCHLRGAERVFRVDRILMLGPAPASAAGGPDGGRRPPPRAGRHAGARPGKWS